MRTDLIARSDFEMKRRGKIARLPKEQREVVNLMLDDGSTYVAVIEYLEKHGVAGVTEQNVSQWHTGREGRFEGGFQEWKRERARLDEMAAKREFALEIVRENEGSKLHEATMQIAASQLYEVLTEFDLQKLKDLVAAQPKQYAAVVNSLAKCAKQALDIEKFREHVRTAKERIERELGVAKDKGGISEETFERINRELKLF